MTTDKMIDKALETANELAYSDYHINLGCDRKATAKTWEKDGKSRTYIKINCYTANGRFKGSYSCGYIDNLTGEYVFTKYDDVDLSLNAECQQETADTAETQNDENQEEDTMNANDSFCGSMTEGTNDYTNEHVAKQEFTSDCGEKAYAVIEIIKDKVTGEVVNGSIYTYTDGGIYYSAADYREAVRMAEGLVSHWDQKDFDWEPKQAVR